MAFPTFLYFSPDRELVHLVVGNDSTAGFLRASADALNPATQHYALMTAKAKQAGIGLPGLSHLKHYVYVP